MLEIRKNLVAILKDEQGQGLVEYGLILTLVSIVAIAALGALGTGVNSSLGKATSAL